MWSSFGMQRAAWLRSNGWRFAAITVALAVVTAPWDGRTTVAGPLAVVPVVVWLGFLARSRRSGLVLGTVLVALMAWVVVPRSAGWTGRWLVPSTGDEFTWYPWLAAGLCALGVRLQRGRAEPPEQRLGLFTSLLTGIVGGMLAICVSCPLWWLVKGDVPGDEGILPMPSGLTVTENDLRCGTEDCVRSVTVTGDRADARVRAHLAAHGYRLRPGAAGSDESHAAARHVTGVLIPHRVWLGYTRSGNGAVVLVWRVESPTGMAIS